MTRPDLNQVANLREQVLFACLMVALVVLFLKMIYLPGTENRDVAREKVHGLVLERNALEKFAATSPVVPLAGLSGKKGMKMKLLAGEVRPAFREVTGLLAELTYPAFLGGVEVKTLSYLAPVQDEGMERIDFTLQVAGRFGAIVQYLGRLDQFPALFQIVDLSMHVSDDPTHVEADLAGRFYQIAPQSPVPVAMRGGTP